MKSYPTYHSSAKKSLILRVTLVIVVSGLLGFLAWWGISLLNHLPLSPARVDVMALWKAGKYDAILKAGSAELEKRPMDTEALIFSGFAAFQKAMSETTEDKRTPLINESVADLRQALLLPNCPLQPQIHYILGKAYFHKGKYFADEAVKELLLARKLGYNASDMNEYLGLSYSLIAHYADAVQYFLAAVKEHPSDLLYWTLGQTYFLMNDLPNATVYLLDAVHLAKGPSLEQRCRFLLGTIYRRDKQFDLATAQYDKILAENPNSADAHYYLGEIQFAQGNKDAARAEWRKAFMIDPLHFNANQRLFN